MNDFYCEKIKTLFITLNTRLKICYFKIRKEFTIKFLNSQKNYFQAYLKYIEDHYPGLPKNLISTLYASEDDAIKLHGPHICSSEDMNENCETMNMKITKNLLMPESFGMKLDQDEKEFIGRLLSFDKFKIQVYLSRARPVQDKIYQVLRKCEKRVHYGKVPST